MYVVEPEVVEWYGGKVTCYADKNPRKDVIENLDVAWRLESVPEDPPQLRNKQSHKTQLQIFCDHASIFVPFLLLLSRYQST